VFDFIFFDFCNAGYNDFALLVYVYRQRVAAGSSQSSLMYDSFTLPLEKMAEQEHP
jgi:hypothetical protein